MNGRIWSSTIAVLLCVLTGCGRVHTTNDGSGIDVVRVEIRGREIVVPPPAGMVEMSRRLRQPIPPRPDRVIGLFAPAEDLEKARRNERTSIFVSASVPAANTDNDSAIQSLFETERNHAQLVALRSQDDSTRRLVSALDAWRAGTEVEIPDPLAGRTGDPVMLLSESVAPKAFQYVALAHWGDEASGGCELHSAVTLLVHGRMLRLSWISREPFSLGALARARAGTADWAGTILAANP